MEDINFEYTIENAGKFHISHYVATSEDNACKALQTKVIIVDSFPVADFTWHPEEPLNGRPVEFTNLTNGTNLSYFWNFGDGNTSTFENPTHFYRVSSDEIFKVYFKVSTKNDCFSDTVKYLNVVDNFVFYIPTAFSPNNDDYNQYFETKVEDVLKYHLTCC